MSHADFLSFPLDICLAPHSHSPTCIHTQNKAEHRAQQQEVMEFAEKQVQHLVQAAGLRAFFAPDAGAIQNYSAVLGCMPATVGDRDRLLQ